MQVTLIIHKQKDYIRPTLKQSPANLYMNDNFSTTDKCKHQKWADVRKLRHCSSGTPSKSAGSARILKKQVQRRTAQVVIAADARARAQVPKFSGAADH